MNTPQGKNKKVGRTKRHRNKWFRWTMEIQVHRSWVADGFELTEERAREMLARTLPYAYGYELKTKVLSSPDRELIAHAQGYISAAQMPKG